MIVLAALSACDEPEPVRLPGVWSDEERAVLASLRLDPTVRPDPTNRWADEPAAAALGQALFFDAGLSGTNTVSCATCHQPALAFTDGRALAQGVGTAKRHTPSIVGSQNGPWFFWDGRADSLWSQALGPLENPAEMASDRTWVAKTVLAGYRDEYAAIFGPPPDLSHLPDHAGPVDDAAAAAAWTALGDADRAAVDRVFANVGKAIAAYERRLVPTPSAFDRYVAAVQAGDATGGGHLDDAQIRGLSFFLRDGNCTSCHLGPWLTDRSFHNLGLPEPTGWDPGRTAGAALVADSPFNCAGPYSDTADCPELAYLDPTFQDFVNAFKTPTLRNVARTAPYMHHGGLATLEDVIAFYDELPGQPIAGHRELTLVPLGMTDAEKSDLIAFLRALDGDPLPPDLLEPPPALVAP